MRFKIKPTLRRVCAAAISVPFVLVPLNASAADFGHEHQAQQTSSRKPYAPTMLILDASGSMGQRDANGTRMDAAKRAVNTVVDAMPDAAQVGMAVYGTSTGSSDAEKAAGCQDVKVLQPPGPVNKTGIKNAVTGITARGYTPIGRALQVAADALPREGPRSIVLVSDGVDTCAPPDPCETAKNLSGQGLDLVVHAVGLGVDEQARGQLTCIANSTGGTYTDAPDSKTLEQVLPRVTASALRNYEPAGIPVTGSSGPSNAPQLQAGQYLDTIAPDQERYYSVNLPKGSTLHFSATTPGQRGVHGTVEALHLALFDSAGEQCSGDDTRVSENASDAAPLTAVKTFDTSDPDLSTQCQESGRYVLSVKRGSDGQPITLPLELVVGFEPPVDAASLPGPTTTVAHYVDPGGQPSSVVGGATFGTAAALPGAGHYTDAIQFGEYVFYKVHVEWGQALVARVHYGGISDESVIAAMNSTVYSPDRQTVSRDNAVYGGHEVVLPSDSSSGKPVPVEYRNREDSAAEIASQSLAGDYYIGVNLGKDDGDPDHSFGNVVPLTLDISLTGQSHDGPQYQTAPNGQAGSVPSAGDTGTKGKGTQSPVVANRADSSFPAYLWIIGAVVLIAIVATVSIVLARRRTRIARNNTYNPYL
ncbi:vWA domain-containing protein [Amycolatopsis taiwanensis]|uniref:vWA domain-containing protein n=1 Tax=Amycolatopsis taiwanensis TaxID=342230 RepID=UPI0004B2CA77|nr:VWA domain-containing protein [Amycolatopsis taiwanensis]